VFQRKLVRDASNRQRKRVSVVNLPIGVATRPLVIHLPISGVLELQIKRCWIHWKANIPGYNLYEIFFSIFIVLRPEYSQEEG